MEDPAILIDLLQVHTFGRSKIFHSNHDDCFHFSFTDGNFILQVSQSGKCVHPQAMVSQTQWVYAEMWVPSGSRLMIEAVWWRPGNKGTSFERLERLSRSLALKKGFDIAGKAWASGDMIWTEDMSAKGSAMEDSPRQDVAQDAGLLASL
jgi:hypothetical protein